MLSLVVVLEILFKAHMALLHRHLVTGTFLDRTLLPQCCQKAQSIPDQAHEHLVHTKGLAVYAHNYGKALIRLASVQ